jgi:septal ring factor EnvC (AmiA/AmiB activator)
MENGELRKDSSNSQFSTINSQLASACAAVVDELAASRTLIDTLENENAALKQRLDTEKRATALLTELNETRRSETEALRTALAAKNETLTAKDAVIASQDKLIETLKRKKSSPWKRIGDVLIGVGLGVLL